MRWADMDLLGHVNNVIYVDYLQEARVDLLRHHGPSPDVRGGLARAWSWCATRCSTSRR